jgi:two-component system chemotaxis response regulator CheB
VNPPHKTRVLVVDDSAIVRQILTDCLSSEPDIEVVGAASDPFVARDMILDLNPDVITLDLEMPRMDGLTFLRKLMRYKPMPVLVISSLAQASCSAALQAIEEGAVEALAKPAGPYSVGDLRKTLAEKVRIAAATRVQRRPAKEAGSVTALARHTNFRSSAIVAMGASTGGTEAIRRVLEELPENFPGTVVTQHIPPVFSKAFAERLNRTCKMTVKEAEEGDEVCVGRVLVAPGDRHMILRRVGPGYYVTLKDGPRVCYQRPSVDVLFGSVAAQAGQNSMGVLLTGMGSDGANGLSLIRQAGAPTIAQDEDTCVVFGMPREAIRLGAAQHVLPLHRIAAALMNELSI